VPRYEKRKAFHSLIRTLSKFCFFRAIGHLVWAFWLKKTEKFPLQLIFSGSLNLKQAFRLYTGENEGSEEEGPATGQDVPDPAHHQASPLLVIPDRQETNPDQSTQS